MFKEMAQALSMNRIDYLLNDPTTPDLKVSLGVPTQSSLRYKVAGWQGKVTEQANSLRAGRCFVTMAAGIDYLQSMRGRPVKSWPGVKVLRVHPERGKALNAYYNRKALCFFSKTVPGYGAVYTADSVDIVAHELGHALLDAQRRDFWSVQALEIWSFHEAYADITAVVALLQHKKIREHVLKETGGDLKKSNVASRLAEQVGEAIYHMENGKGGYYKDCLRDATIKFAYRNPAQLPRNAPHNKLCAECHSFGRVFLGAWYEILVGLYELNRKAGQKNVVALKNACNTAFSYLVQAVTRAPRVVRFYNAISSHLLSLFSRNPEQFDVVQKVLVDYNLVKPRIKILKAGMNKVYGSLDDMQQDRYVHVSRNETIKLSDHLPKDVVHAFAVNELADIELEIPNDSYYEFDERGNLLEEINSTQDEIVNEARLCAAIIQSTQQIGSEEDTMWEVQSNRLRRTYIE
jgi:hypothetical protein